MTGPSNHALSSRWNVFVLNYTQLLSSYHLLLNVQVVLFFRGKCVRTWRAGAPMRYGEVYWAISDDFFISWDLSRWKLNTLAFLRPLTHTKQEIRD